MTVCVGGEKSYMPEFLHIYSTGLVISVKLGKLEISYQDIFKCHGLRLL